MPAPRENVTITWKTITPAPPPKAAASDTVLRNVLPACEALSELLRSAATSSEPILLAVNDPHRSTQTRPVLAALANRARTAVRSGGLRFRAIVAAGTHRFKAQERREFEHMTFLGCELNIEQIEWHDATDVGSLVEIAGVRMHRAVAESRFLLPIGSVEPHYFAGLTGPHKTITVGCMSREDIERNHEGAMSPASDILCLERNPVHDGIADVLQRLRALGKTICAIGEVVCADSIVAAAVGDPLSVLDELSPCVRDIYVRRISDAVDVLHLRVPLPLGRNLYQVDKALKNNHLAVRDGGGILVEADCFEGIGPDAFMDLLRGSTDYASARQTVLDRGYRLGDHKAVKLHHLMDPACRGVRVAVVSPNLQESDLRDTGIEVFRETQPAVDRLKSTVAGPFARGLIIEDAGMVTVTPDTLTKPL